MARPAQLNASGQLQNTVLTARYAPRVYSRSFAYDAADREISATTGAAEITNGSGQPAVPQLLSAANQSACTTTYTRRGTVKASGSSYGGLVSDIRRGPDGLVHELRYGDAADTRTAYLYDERRRISSVQTYRGPPASGAWGSNHPLASGTPATEPTRQLTLQDEDFTYDVVGNPVEIRDWRNPSDWPDGAKPVTKKIQYDDLNRAIDVRYEYPGGDGDDDWKSPYANETDGNVNNDDPRRARPSPHVSFARRILRQSFQYDWLGNSSKTSDDAGGFYDRSLGTIQNDAPAKPYQLKAATLAAGSGVISPGSLDARYDAAGNMTGMTVERGGACLQAGTSIPGACNQRFVYQWDEVGRLSRARRWDGNQGGTTDVGDLLPTQTPAADLRYGYDASDQRVIKQAVDAAAVSSFTLYIFESLELRRTQWNGTEYTADSWTVVPYLLANGVRLARVVYDPAVPKGSQTSGQPGFVSQSSTASGNLHVVFELGDHLGSTSVVLDKATGELVERATFQAYGGAESDFRPDRWKAFREDYRFTGKEEDAEVGLQYFGKRYLNPLLGRWISADPLAVHAPGQADLNVYAYVSGAVLKNVDPLGLDDDEEDVVEVTFGDEVDAQNVVDDETMEYGRSAGYVFDDASEAWFRDFVTSGSQLEAEQAFWRDADRERFVEEHALPSYVYYGLQPGTRDKVAEFVDRSHAMMFDEYGGFVLQSLGGDRKYSDEMGRGKKPDVPFMHYSKLAADFVPRFFDRVYKDIEFKNPEFRDLSDDLAVIAHEVGLTPGSEFKGNGTPASDEKARHPEHFEDRRGAPYTRDLEDRAETGEFGLTPIRDVTTTGVP